MNDNEVGKLKEFEEQAKQFEVYLSQLGYVRAVRCRNCQNSRKKVSEFGMPEIECTHFGGEVCAEDWCAYGVAR